MQFYKITSEIKSNGAAAENESNARKATRAIISKTVDFNAEQTSAYCFLSDKNEDALTVGVIVTGVVNIVALAEKYASCLGFDVDGTEMKEITFNSLQTLLHSADREGYVENDSDVLELFGLDRICGRLGRGIEFGENLSDFNASKKQLVARAEKLFASETLIPEIERILAGIKSFMAEGHPVHYIVEADDRDTRRELYKVILDALHSNLRLRCGRYSFLDFRPNESYSQMAYEALYKVSEGGAVVVRYLAGDDSEEDFTASSSRNTIENICEMAKKYRNKVLTIICMPRNCKSLKAQFYENLGSMSFVEIREDFISGDNVKKHLSRLARESRVRTDKKLFENVDFERHYLAAELQVVFDDWYNEKLKRSVYPQYKDIAVAHKETVKAKPQGSAYDELMEMIGLQEAKSVIKKALNYYKMQKLYEAKGVKNNAPAMHMIFSGNPGTAKTTVARLFARIMKENGLLSRGQMVECGRGDLVGKFVGWTAPNVQAKFKEASGGVLFIDEAYSLVDDRDGSYGDEAINTIVQEMENHRADVVVIFAGYTDKMEGFLNKNPGLRSRIAFHVPFADYDSEELCLIADMISRKSGMKIEDDARVKLGRAFDVARQQNDFGNGRYVRNLFEQAKMNQASRLLEKDFDDITAEDVTTITAADVVIPEPSSAPVRRIGFA